MLPIRGLPAVLVLVAGLSDTARGQSAKPSPAPPAPAVTAEPASTSATYGDWVLRCETTGDGNTRLRACEVAQTLQVKDQTQPIAQIAFGRVTAADPIKLTIVLPTNVSFPSSVKLGLGDKDPQPVDLAWHRCLPGFCMADGIPPADALKTMRAASDPGRLSYKDATGRDVALPVSFRGLQQALDALAKS